MASILDNRPALKAQIDKVAEVAGYLWQKGWAERNGGNITINVTQWVDEQMRSLPAIDGPRPIGTVLPNINGCWFYCKGTGKRMRDLSRAPMENGSLIRVVALPVRRSALFCTPIPLNLWRLPTAASGWRRMLPRTCSGL